MPSPVRCTHGSIQENLDFFRPIHYYVQMCELQKPALEYDAFVEYWVLNPNIICEQGSKILKSMAISCVLENECDSWRDARLYLGIATKFDAVLALNGKIEAFKDAVQYNAETMSEQGTDPRLRSYYQAVQQICSNQGLLQYLVAQNACHCLDDIARQSGVCDTCLKSHEKVLQCAKCQTAKYCTVDCQKRDWKHHKRYCQKMLHLQQKLVDMPQA